MGVNLAKDDEEVCSSADIVLLAVKPQNAAEALAQCKKALEGKAMMSIVAGVTVERLQDMIDGATRILRIMPNTPAMVFKEPLHSALTMISTQTAGGCKGNL